MTSITTLIKKIACLFVLVLLTGCTSFLFQPQRAHFMSPELMGIEYQDIVIKAPDSTYLHGWKLLAEGDLRLSTTKTLRHEEMKGQWRWIAVVKSIPR